MTRRCSTCSINYPNNSTRFKECQVCGQETSFLSHVDPDGDWKETVELKKMATPERRDDVYWWRAQEMYRAGLGYERALLLAGYSDVDLHEAVELIQKAGGDLAYEILT